jgi:tetratricopeptide (TPR) repeat protein
MSAVVMNRRRIRASGWFFLAGLGLCLLWVLALKIQEYLRVDRDAGAARAAVLAGKFYDAREPATRWLRARPNSADAHLIMAQLALEEGDLGKVTDELNRAQSLGYPKAGLDRVHAITLARMGRYAEAEPILTQLYHPETTPDAAVAQALARVYMMTYRLRQAESAIRQWMSAAPRDGRPYLWLTEFDRRVEVDNSEALEEHYRAALARDPQLDQARLGLAETLRSVHRNAEAALEYQLYLDRHPDDAAALAGAGHNALELQQHANAIELLDRALAVAPSNVVALKGRAAIDTARGDRKAALERLDQAIRADPYDTEALYSRSRLKSASGDEAGAKKDLDAFKQSKKDQAELLKIRGLIMINPDDNELRTKIAAWMFAHGRDSDGLGWARSVLATDPANAVSNALLADYYSERKHDPGLANFYRLRASTARRGTTGGGQ